VHNLSTRSFPADATYGRRLVRLGAQLMTEDGVLINPGFCARGPARTHRRRRRRRRRGDIPAGPAPGRYAVKFDLVSEGVDWFERCGSDTTLKKLWVSR
jgi:hypothetical protein